MLQVVYAIAVALWSITLLERWKRREARLSAHWFVSHENALEEVMPEYVSQATAEGTNKVRSPVFRGISGRARTVSLKLVFHKNILKPPV